ncbi:MAG: oxidoreductase [Rhodobacteraceae bacterium]|nr:MAG: oxidoreductase [Paracoccaceae bacterium]|tara:strand:+ start:455 stop:1345 length:891 start_codon:yes stop_codon:yes gene_type:complete
MQRVKLSPQIEVSQLAYGKWRLTDDQDMSVEHIRNKLAACLDQGITTIDQADIYGGYQSEEILGNALRGTALRNQIEIITKCDIIAPVGRHRKARVKYYDTTRAHILASVDQSLQLMAIEHIDLLLLHRPDPLMNHFETGGALDELVVSGKVRAVGTSNFHPYDWQLLQSAMKTPLVTNQIELSVLAHEPLTNGDVAFHQMNATPIMAWSPLAGGDLFAARNQTLLDLLSRIGSQQGADAAAVAVAWLLAHPARIIPVMGTNSIARIERLSDALTVSIDRQTWYEIYTAALGHEVA